MDADPDCGYSQVLGKSTEHYGGGGAWQFKGIRAIFLEKVYEVIQMFQQGQKFGSFRLHQESFVCYYSLFVMERELSQKLQLSILHLIYVPALTYGCELCVQNECPLAGLSLSDQLRSSEIQLELRVEPLFHCVIWGPGANSVFGFGALPGRSNREGYLRETEKFVGIIFFYPAWEYLSIPQEKMGSFARERDICEVNLDKWTLYGWIANMAQRSTVIFFVLWLLSSYQHSCFMLFIISAFHPVNPLISLTSSRSAFHQHNVKVFHKGFQHYNTNIQLCSSGYKQQNPT